MTSSADTLRRTPLYALHLELGGKKPMRQDVVTPKGYLQPGDEVICEIEGVGRLVNKVVAAS